ncbi:ABC transporter permease [Oceanobacillus luteolus]|uniref:ABC transporter permease n=1 Tax=Oceanobacillus luteolus TaxID=1274358 RepID=A0ABW4HP00_9BACI|nr:ABC transporter permease [Oceanobacillus luteolus]MCM3740010.1 ABC transporter permease [Oceanobacillus luteolus]
MDSFFIKDVLVFWRDRKEVLLALLLPIVLIVVLNFAFSSIFGVDDHSTNLEVALIQEDDTAAGIEQFEVLLTGMELSEEEKQSFMQQAALFAPGDIIVSFLQNDDMKEWIHLHDISESEAMTRVENGHLDAIIRIPEGFTYDVLTSLALGETSNASLVIMTEKRSSEVTTLQNIMDQFLRTMNYQFALGSITEGAWTEPDLPTGGREVMENVEPYTMLQYLTVAMTALFALFLSQTVAIKTYTEKREHVFDRIILSNSNPIHFLLGKMFATFCLVWLQMLLTIGVAQIALGVFEGKSMEFWIGFFVMMTIYSLTIAGLAALFTSLALNIKDMNMANGIMSLVVLTFGLIGGGFFPIQGLPEMLQNMGAWVPNGITQIAMIEWIQLSQVENLIPSALLLLGSFVVFFAIGYVTFPKRGRSV